MNRARWTLTAVALAWHLGGLSSILTAVILATLLTGCTP